MNSDMSRPPSEEGEDTFLLGLWQEPRRAFARELRDRLKGQETRRVRLSWPLRMVARGAPVRGAASGMLRVPAKWVFVAVSAVLAAGLVALPVVARGVLPHLRAREVSPPAHDAIPVYRHEGPVTFGPTPAGPRWEPLEQLSRVVGGRLLVPTYLPADCTAKERFTFGAVQVANLNYQCVAISEQVIGERVARPTLAEGASEELIVNGIAAMYVKGGWVDAESSALIPLPSGSPAPTPEPDPSRRGRAQLTWVWREDFEQSVMLEQNGLLVTLRSRGAYLFPKQELLRIDASLRPGQGLDG